VKIAAALFCLVAAGTAAAADQFGAIAYSAEAWVYGLSRDRSSRDDAEKVAMSLCSARAAGCELVLWYRNACGAVAVGVRGYGGGTGTSPALADKYAMQSCSLYGGAGCTVTGRACTSNATQ
jgi:serine/threonine-protein kinase